jgi:hypothetical protein
MRALITLNERVASPNEIAKELDEPLGVVSYHVRQLLDLDCIELVKTEPRRGATEHYYRATKRAIFDDGWDKLPKETRTAISSGLLSNIWRDVGRAITAGTFDKQTGRHLSWTNLVLDEEGWEEVNERLAEFVMWALDLQAEAAGRIADGEPAIVSKLTLMHYPAPGTARKSTPTRARRRRSRAKA